MTDPNGNIVTEMMYKAWGEVRYSTGSMPTDYTYTPAQTMRGQAGQRSEMDGLGLMFYNARWLRSLRPRAAKRREGYDPELGRFAQADNIIPARKVSVSWDRYAYVRNNPISFNDPSGHDVGCAGRDASECASQKPISYPESLDIKSSNIIISLLEQDNDSIIPQSITSLINSATPQTTKEHTITPSTTPSPIPTKTCLFTPTSSYVTPSPDQISEEGPSLSELVVDKVSIFLESFDVDSVPEAYPYDIFSPFENISPDINVYIEIVRIGLTLGVSVWNRTDKIREILNSNIIYPLPYPVPYQ